MALSPMMQQYNKIKSDYDDCLLFYRLGDFYELFYQDAYTASRELELTLTGRNCGMKEKAPMCGVPFHSADSYISKLVERGYKVAICEQTEDPESSKGIVDRDVVRVITPGTLDISGATDGSNNLYLASVYSSEEKIAIAYCDITTGEMFATDIDNDGDANDLLCEISRIEPREIILCRDNEVISGIIRSSFDETYIDVLDMSYFRYTSCESSILSLFHMISLTPLSIDSRPEIVCATGALIMYLTETQRGEPIQIRELILKERGDRMRLDRSTIRNLELLETIYEKKSKGSLLGVLDRTRTAMGARLLKRFIKEPLTDPKKIMERQDACEALVDDISSRRVISDLLTNVYDFERLTARVASGRANGPDLLALRKTISQLPGIKDALSKMSAPLIFDLCEDIADFTGLDEMIGTSIREDASALLTEGGLIKNGYSKELDDIKDSIKDARSWIANLENIEKERTGIKTLKVGYNKVFGYYIDVSRGQSENVPDEYIRKQTLVNNERYITPELKEKESLVLSAEAKINALEYDIFKKIRTQIEPYIDDLQRTSKAIAYIDVLTSFADVAATNRYVKPIVDDSEVIDISDGRHPAVEQLVGEGMFVSNDTVLDRNGKSLFIITGPNMSGKSTYMRQTAVIVLMAQMGSFVPCSSAHIGAVDNVYTRIGASDNLAYGQSTFYIEMSELANILRNSTERSLIILDEIGRGTSTFDGLSIAWATIEYLSSPDHRIRTMFATHYHELTDMESQYDSIQNLSVDVSESGNDIVFLHKIVPGPASKSYGIHVAKIAGVPKDIRKSAESKLRELESTSDDPIADSVQLSMIDRSEIGITQVSLYDDIMDDITDIDINTLTPLEALNELKDLQDRIKGTKND